MSIRRISALALVVVALAACSSSPAAPTAAGDTTSAAASDTATPTDSASASDTPTDSASPSDTASSSDSSAPVAAAADFCAAWKEVTTVTAETNVDGLAAKFAQAATDLEATAPDEIKAAAGTYKTLLTAAGQIAEGGKFDAAAYAQAMAGLGDKVGDITTVTLYAAKNCN